MMTRTTGSSAFLSLLKDEGITHLFGNPGTTELPVMLALMDHPELTYVMAMQESLVVAMADGFSRASGKLVACNVHVAPGLGNAMGSLYNARFTGTPTILVFYRSSPTAVAPDDCDWSLEMPLKTGFRLYEKPRSTAG
ncbi:MAG TPA: thiamine pyrophosphate-binding protein, partial [Thermoanaerobaculia bacterium]|nr:thiamine pyrophosphate-binding protein [Thermoanaerobaculia bacterium]